MKSQLIKFIMVYTGTNPCEENKPSAVTPCEKSSSGANKQRFNNERIVSHAACTVESVILLYIELVVFNQQ